MQSFAIDGRVVAEAVRLLADRSDIGRFAGAKDRSEDQPLAERSLEITGYDGMQMRRDIAQLDIRAILQIFRFAAYGSAELDAGSDAALHIKTIAGLEIDGVFGLVGFDIAGVNASDELVLRVRD